MKKEEFCKKLAEALDVENAGFDQHASLQELDSLAVMSIIAVVDESVQKKLSAAELMSLTTVGSLMEKIGWQEFA